MSAAVASELATVERRAQIVDLAKTGKPYRAIASELGIASSATIARHVAAWAAEMKPSAEVSEELRQLRRLEIDGLRERSYARLLAAEAREDDASCDRINLTLIRLMEREAKLMNLDLAVNVQVNVLPTAEQLAALFGWDATAVIEGTAVEGTAVEEVVDDQ